MVAHVAGDAPHTGIENTAIS